MGAILTSGAEDHLIDGLSFKPPNNTATYVLENRNSFPVNKNAAKIVASKIVGGEQALAQFELRNDSDELRRSFTNSVVFRDPARYKVITTALQRTIYDIKTPEETTDLIIETMMEKKS